MLGRDVYGVRRQRSELLDFRTCNYCLSIDGRVFEKTDRQFAALQANGLGADLYDQLVGAFVAAERLFGYAAREIIGQPKYLLRSRAAPRSKLEPWLQSISDFPRYHQYWLLVVRPGRSRSARLASAATRR